MVPTHNSVMLPNWLAYGAKVDPADYLILGSAQHEVRNWSKGDLAKFLRRSHDVRNMLIPGRKNDNVFDKEFLSGMQWLFIWPTIDNLSGKTFPRHWALDFDRIIQDVDKEGNPYDLLMKRAETFMRFGMTVAESSPGFDISDPKWTPRTPHEAPPTEGILKLYNRGDRRRWNWKCEQCSGAFEPSFKLFDFPGKHEPKQVYHDPMDAAEQVTLVCPICGYPHTMDMKDHLNSGGRWVKEGQLWLPPKNEFILDPRCKLVRSNIASFWLKGPAAAFQDWSKMVTTWLTAQKEYDELGIETALKKTVNTDHGEPYLPKAMISDRSPEILMAKAEDWGASEECRSVPPWVRFLVATVDVQARGNASFVFQVHGVDAQGNITIIDSDKIIFSTRKDEEGRTLRIDPQAFALDWDVLIDEIMMRTYPLSDGSGRRMGIYLTGCDSGGAEGTTPNAYAFWRRLKERQDGLHRKFVLIKGKGGKGGKVDAAKPDKPDETTPSTRVLWPDNNQGTKKFAAALGDVPVLELNPWILKDMASNLMLRRIREDDNSEGGGAIRFPTWMPAWFYNQLTNEVRTDQGWQKIGSRRNEAWDLLYYALGLLVRPRDLSPNAAPWLVIRYQHIAWEDPPSWADVWDKNPLVWSEGRAEQRALEHVKKTVSFAELGGNLA
ncbi:DNA packaging protein [Asticcacaulis sp. AC466]|nr:DNA packaging protein [Asticcacaulis sp. AC466]